MLPPLAAVLARAGSPRTAEAGAHRENSSVGSGVRSLVRFTRAQRTAKAAKDVVEVLQWLSDGDLPESVASFRFDPRGPSRREPRQRAIYRGAICLILDGGARDFHTQAVITGKLMAEEGIDDHHVFPSVYLADAVPARSRDCVLNRTLIDRTTKQMISARAPSDYLADIRSTPGFPVREGFGLARSARRRRFSAAVRRLRGVLEIAPGALVAGDSTCYGRDGGGGSRSRRQRSGTQCIRHSSRSVAT